MDADEAAGELFFQRLQRFLDQVLAARVVHHHVLLFGLQVVDVVQRNQPQAAAQACAQYAACLLPAVRLRLAIATGQERACPCNRRGQAFGATGFIR